PTELPFPTGFDSQNGLFLLYIFSLKQPYVRVGQTVRNLQRQVNLVDGLSAQKGAHALKFGVDYRRLTPVFDPTKYEQLVTFNTVADAEAGRLRQSSVQANNVTTLLFRNLGAYAQDTWRALPRLTITYGVRWDVDFVPQTTSGPNFPAITGFDPPDLSNLALDPQGKTPYSTSYGKVAPRIGLAYAVTTSQTWQTVIRGGFGIFYDLASSQFGGQLTSNHYPFGVATNRNGGLFPLDFASAAPPAIVPPTAANRTTLYAFDPSLEMPYTFEWNVALEQRLGRAQTAPVLYVGDSGQELLQTLGIIAPNQSLFAARVVTNSGSSSYNALQIQFQRRLSRGLQGLASYTWSHSTDTGSAGSTAVPSNIFV